MKQLVLLAFLVPWLTLSAQDAPEKLDVSLAAQMKQIEAGLEYKTGEITLGQDLATLSVPSGFRFLSPDDAQMVLVNLWGNPEGEKPLGMIFPADVSPLSDDSWGVIITYSDDGYVKDSDADKIDYAELLEEMQDSTRSYNKERKKAGYPEIELVGWATPPRYDKTTRKMYWAKELKFSDSEENTLNYGIRVLGRRGVLVLNAVASMKDLALIEKHTPDIVGMVQFKEGNRYADFDGKTDKVAAYGLAALVAGGVATKAGFFKMIWLAILAGKKFVILGLFALVAGLSKFFGKKPTS